MTEWVVDTNVLIVANGRHDDGAPVSLSCRGATVEFLMDVINGPHRILLDAAGEILGEYRPYVNPNGQPGVGDQFFMMAQRGSGKVDLVEVPRGADGEFEDLHADIIASGFDPSDRKFAVVAQVRRGTVANAVDSDWLERRDVLERCGVRIKFLCGDDMSTWRCAGKSNS